MPQRIQRKRTKGWKMPDGAVYVGRPTKWGNPFGKWYLRFFGIDLALKLYADMAQGIWDPRRLDGWECAGHAFADTRDWRDRMGEHPLEAIRRELAGKDLCCWCPLDQPCHADALLELANAPAVATNGEAPVSVSPCAHALTAHIAPCTFGRRRWTRATNGSARFTVQGRTRSDMLTTPAPLPSADTLAVLRVAVIEGHRNACSALYGACAKAGKAMGAENMITYTHADETGVKPQGGRLD